jgi:hypothetical protein
MAGIKAEAGLNDRVGKDATLNAAHVDDLPVAFDGKTIDGKKIEVCADINHLSDLNLDNIDELNRQVTRKLDTWMLPQVWILYLFNYLNRTNIAQARLNTFDEDLNLKDGDYQVRIRAATTLRERSQSANSLG